MNNITTIKERLGKIQKHFNPEKSTYKVLEHVINDDLTSFGILMELSKIRGVSKYPDDIKTEYISIINDLKEIITEERKIEHQRRQEESTKELKDLISRLEKRKDLHPERVEKVESVQTDPSATAIVKKIVEDSKSEPKDVSVKKSTKTHTSRKNDLNSKLNIYLFIMLIILIIIIILLFIFY